MSDLLTVVRFSASLSLSPIASIVSLRHLLLSQNWTLTLSQYIIIEFISYSPKLSTETVVGLCKGNPRVLWRLLNHTADRGENQREKSKVSPLPVSTYYATPNYDQGYYSVCTDPALCGPLTDPGCMYMSYFTSTVTSEVKVEQSSDLRVEWNLEQQKCEMGCP